MKSIIQEENSVFRAIEKGWIKAGKPRNFSVKILEEEQKNFIGFTKKPAKIAFLFEETKQAFSKKKPFKKPIVEKYKKGKTLEVKPKKPQIKKSEKTTTTFWKDEMVDSCVKWTKDVLPLIKLPHIKFTTNIKKYHLKLHFNSHLLEDKNRERALFRNFSFLLMQSLRNKFKKPFNNLKVVFTSD